MMPSVQTLYDVIETTWPPASTHVQGPFTLRDGAGGGKRVSAATTTTARQPVTAEELPAAERAMADMGQPPLFMIRNGDTALDTLLEAQGYDVIDAVNLYVGDVATLTAEPVAKVTAFCIWEPLAVMRDLWKMGGIGPERVAVMERATCPKTALFGRDNNRPAGAAYVGIHRGIAMVHALEIHPNHRRAGLGRHMMRQAAHWAADNGATQISAVCTQANANANALYSSLGMALVGTYHYRIKKDAIS